MRNPLNFFNYLPHYLRKRIDERYIVIESDDWGLERALAFNAIASLEKKHGREKMTRWTYDTLETPDDLYKLYDVLDKYKNKFDLPPVITANFITHNIDYRSEDKLRFLPISKGFNNNGEELKNIYKTGIENNLIFPQLHGYCHYNLGSVMKYFDSEEGKEAFRKKFFFGRSTIKGNLKFLHGELSYENPESYRIKEASEVFKEAFGFFSKSLIPPTFILDHNILNTIRDSGISLIQSSNRLVTSENKRFRFPYFKKREGMIWSIRNCRLDPHTDYGFYHDQCIESIRGSFENKIPAVIDFHRVNFSGRFAPDYRDRTIKELDLLFNEIHKKWPEAKFIHSQKLNDILWQQETK